VQPALHWTYRWRRCRNGVFSTIVGAVAEKETGPDTSRSPLWLGPPDGAMKWGEMNEQLAVSVGGGTADPAAAGSAVAPVVAVFVDATGRRRRLVMWLGWLVALACGDLRTFRIAS
jgi:hypothetical protein